MKKNLLSILVLLGATAMVASCAPKTSDTTPTGDTTPTDTTPPHSHAFGDWTVTTPATCGEAGEETRTCECGETETRSVPATEDHTWGEWGVTDSATCGAAGEEARTCETCGASETRELPATGDHTYEDGVYLEGDEPTSSTAGTWTVTCTGCGGTERSEDAWTCESAVRAVAAAMFGQTVEETLIDDSYMYDEEDDVFYTGGALGSSTDVTAAVALNWGVSKVTTALGEGWEADPNTYNFGSGATGKCFYYRDIEFDVIQYAQSGQRGVQVQAYLVTDAAL